MSDGLRTSRFAADRDTRDTTRTLRGRCHSVRCGETRSHQEGGHLPCRVDWSYDPLVTFVSAGDSTISWKKAVENTYTHAPLFLLANRQAVREEICTIEYGMRVYIRQVFFAYLWPKNWNIWTSILLIRRSRRTGTSRSYVQGTKISVVKKRGICDLVVPYLRCPPSCHTTFLMVVLQDAAPYFILDVEPCHPPSIIAISSCTLFNLWSIFNIWITC